MRSKLFVPGTRTELFSKALASEADAVSFDLEDAVMPQRKAEARLAIQALLRLLNTSPEAAAAARGKVLIVRVNAPGTVHFAADIAAVVQPGLHLLNLPKPESVEDVLAAASAIEAAERANGVQTPVQLLLNIETPRALRLAAALAGAHPRVAGLQLGLGDLFEPLQINRHHAGALQQVLLQLRLAAGEAGVFAYDGAFARVDDPAGYRAEAELARQLGFLGKSCIHPSQVPLANAVFQPSTQEIEQARKLVAAATQAETQGAGAYLVDGAMVDAPFVLRARQLLAQARRLGLTGDG